MDLMRTEDRPRPEFSVVIACYHEEMSIDEFCQRLIKTMDSTNRTYEIILTNDGSTDRTWDRLRSIFHDNPKVSTVINFYRNYGQAAAMLAGYREAVGEHIVFLDSDLQLDPEEFPVLLKEFDKDMDIVTGYREVRQDSLFRILPSLIANMIARRVTGKRLKDIGCTFKIIRGDLVRAFEAGPFKPWSTLHIIRHASRIAEVPVSHHPRKHGKSGYTFAKLYKTNMDNVVQLSQNVFQVLSIVFLICAAFFLGRVLLSWAFPGLSILDEITLGLVLNAVTINAFLTIGMLCIVGELAVRNFITLNNDPLYIIRDMHKK